MHPSQALFQDKKPPIFLPVCDHYAGSEKLMRKSMALQNALGPVFDITFDCEDGASVGNELEHIKTIGRLLASEENSFQRIGVRVHDVAHPFFETDIQYLCSLAAKNIAYIVLPKVNSAEEVATAILFINNESAKFGRIHIPIHVLIETQSALADVNNIAELLQVECLSFGIMDFISSHWGAIPANAMHTPEQFTHPLVIRAKLEISAACHLHGKVASHNVTTEFNDSEVVLNDATVAAMKFAYTRMWSIHPSQIRPIVKAMQAESTQIDEAVLILRLAQKENWGPIEINGRLHDRASYRYYWSILKKASVRGASLTEEAWQLV
jgi:citrate lyase subunit beta/citryl-CoA lyase